MEIPLCVDLDGTLVETDMLVESAKALLRSAPLKGVLMPFWLLKGRAHLKRQIALRVDFDPATLPYNVVLLDMIRKAREGGRYLLLATASDEIVGNRIAGHLGFFDEVLGSDGVRNLRGAEKALVLSERFGFKGFDYAGNSAVDLPVWEKCREAIVVGEGRKLVPKLVELGIQVFVPEDGGAARS